MNRKIIHSSQFLSQLQPVFTPTPAIKKLTTREVIESQPIIANQSFCHQSAQSSFAKSDLNNR
jgi:hypothetical protein